MSSSSNPPANRSNYMPIQPQWSLDSTSNSVLSVAKGILHAATSDNVQPIAILACERFGNTLAICQETSRKIETTVVPVPKSATIQFLHAMVGYSKNDCVAQFGNSLAGVQFLALAAAMSTTMGSFTSAQALQRMLKSSAADKTLLPTTRQLQQLLDNLAPRCQVVRFTDSVAGWHIFLNQFGKVHKDYRLWTEGLTHPDAKGVHDLVETFRQLARLGESSAMKATIRTVQCVAWVVAFTKWCLGIPPSVFLENGIPVLEQPDSQVIVVACSDNSNPRLFEVSIEHTISGPSDLLASEIGEEWNGMVGIRTYGQFLLQRLGLDRNMAYRALTQALPYALRLVIDSIHFTNGHENDKYLFNRVSGKVDIPDLLTIPFRDDRAVSNVASLLIDNGNPVDLQTLQEGLLIHDLPLVALHLTSLKYACRCNNCSVVDHAIGDSCLQDDFFSIVAEFVADTLSLSLFHFPEDLQVHLRPYRPIFLLSVEGNFQAAVHAIIKNTPYSCNVERLIRWTHSLIGHDIHEDGPTSNWVMSSYRGQTVYPTIFESRQVSRRGYLALTWLPGQLRYGDEKYDVVRSRQWNVDSHDSITESNTEPVMRPCNLALPASEVMWNVHAGDGYIEAGLTLHESAQQISPVIRAPTAILLNLGYGLVVESCPHERNVKLEKENRFCTYTGPIVPVVPKSGGGRGSAHDVITVGVVAVDRSDDLRLFALAYSGGDSRATMVIRKNACLQCCLDVCRRADCDAIIL